MPKASPIGKNQLERVSCSAATNGHASTVSVGVSIAAIAAIAAITHTRSSCSRTAPGATGTHGRHASPRMQPRQTANVKGAELMSTDSALTVYPAVSLVAHVASARLRRAEGPMAA